MFVDCSQPHAPAPNIDRDELIGASLYDTELKHADP